jgi:hypothetical protein
MDGTHGELGSRSETPRMALIAVTTDNFGGK